MTRWWCEIEDCATPFDSADALLAHQLSDHPAIECKVCGDTVPDGFYAIRHVFAEHTRAKYVRHYDGDADAIRHRESILATVEEATDPDAILERAEVEHPTETDRSAVSAGD